MEEEKHAQDLLKGWGTIGEEGTQASGSIAPDVTVSPRQCPHSRDWYY
jgi:hypothetical protein